MKKNQNAGEDLVINLTSSLIFLYRAALLEVLSNKLQNAKQKAERNCETKKRKSGMNASYSNYFMNSNLLLTEFISKLIKTS